METTLTILKPDSVGDGDAGKILAQLEGEGFKIRALKKLRLTEAQARAFYEVHKERPFYAGLIEFITSGPVVAMAWRGTDAISVCRNVIGPTDGSSAPGGTIRGDFALEIGKNLVHGSDGEETAEFELGLWFPEGEVDWERVTEEWVYE